MPVVGIGVFADVAQATIWRCAHPGFRWALNLIMSVFIRHPRGEDTERHTETEARGRQRQRLELCYYKPWDARSPQDQEEARKGAPPEPSAGAQPHQYLGFGLLGSPVMRE